MLLLYCTDAARCFKEMLAVTKEGLHGSDQPDRRQCRRLCKMICIVENRTPCKEAVDMIDSELTEVDSVIYSRLFGMNSMMSVSAPVKRYQPEVPLRVDAST